MIFSKTIFAAALALVALGAQAANQTIYSSPSAPAEYTFSLGALSDVSIGYSWSDMSLTKNSATTYYDASSLNWTLTRLSNNAVAETGSFTDANTIAADNGTISLLGLSADSYRLAFAGTWADVTKNGNGNANFTNVNGTVNLDGTSFKSTLVAAPVPEPETYAMMLAGLGLMGTIARRRKQKSTSV